MALPKVAILGSCFLILLATIVGSMVYFSHQKDKGVTNDVANTSTSLKAIQHVCQNTYYQETCVKTISKSTNSSDSYEIVKAAFRLAVTEIGNAIHKSVTLQKAAKEPKTIEAFQVCQKLLNDSIDDLNKTCFELEAFHFSDLNKFVDDLQTWLAGAQTYQQTCLDVFEDTKNEKMKKLLKKGSELTSNALALVNEISKILSSSEAKGFTRKLLSSKNIKFRFRRLLEANPWDIKPNLTVAQDGSGEFKTINEALSTVPLKSNETFVIYIKEGVYFEYVTIPKQMWHVIFIGDGPTKTRISGNKSKGGGLGTYMTATLGNFSLLIQDF